MSDKREITYEEAWTRLQEILEELESGTTAIDNLDALIKESAELVKLCENKLRNVEAKLKQDEG